MYPINLGAQGLDQLALLFASLHEARFLQRRDVLIGDLCRQVRRTRTNRYVDKFSARRAPHCQHAAHPVNRSEEHTSELQSLMRISYAVFCLKKKNNDTTISPCH